MEELYRGNLCKNVNQVDANTWWALVATHLRLENELKHSEYSYLILA